MIEHVILLIGLGLGTGLLSGLLGIGGGVVVVPALFYIFHTMGLPQNHLMQYAVGTSLGVMVISSSSAVTFHIKHFKPNWFLLWMLCPSVFIGVLIGTSLGHSLPTHWLQRIFALLLIIVAYKLMRTPKADASKQHCSTLSFKAAAPLGGTVGFCSGLLGIGGGVITVPFLLHKHFIYRHAVILSLLMSVTAAITGVAVYMILGLLHAHASLPGFVGDVYVSGALLVAIGAIPGTYMASKILAYCPINLLKKVFALLLILTSFHMVYASFV